MNIAYIPSSNKYYNNLLFSNNNERDNVLEPYTRLKKWCEQNNINLHTFDIYDSISDIDIILVSRFEYNLKNIFRSIKANPLVKIIYIVSEEINIAPLYIENILNNKLFDVVLTWRDDMIDNEYFIKYYYPNPIREMIHPVNISKKKFLIIINSYKYHVKANSNDLYQERIKAIKHFARNSEIDLYGVGWEKCNEPLIKGVYLGSVESKIDVIKNYKFAFAFENSNNEIGGICEKIFDVMAAGCVPIYWGAPNVLDYIPKETFIDFRDFMDYKKLNEYLQSITENEYNNYLYAISLFMKSDEYYKFTSIGFVKDVSTAIKKVEQLPPKRKSLWKIKWDFFKKIICYPKIFWDRKRFLYDFIKTW